MGTAHDTQKEGRDSVRVPGPFQAKLFRLLQVNCACSSGPGSRRTPSARQPQYPAAMHTHQLTLPRCGIQPKSCAQVPRKTAREQQHTLSVSLQCAVLSEHVCRPCNSMQKAHRQQPVLHKQATYRARIHSTICRGSLEVRFGFFRRAHTPCSCRLQQEQGVVARPCIGATRSVLGAQHSAAPSLLLGQLEHKLCLPGICCCCVQVQSVAAQTFRVCVGRTPAGTRTVR